MASFPSMLDGFEDRSSTFHTLLKQVAEEYERAVAEASFRGPRSKSISMISRRSKSRTSEHLSIPARSPLDSSEPTCMLTQELTEQGVVTHGSGVVKGTLTSPENLSTTDHPGDLIKLHPEWLLNSDELRISANLCRDQQASQTFNVVPSMQTAAGGVMMKTSVLSSLSWGFVYWDVFGVLCILFDVFWIPVQIGFDSSVGSWVRVGDWIARIYWTLDLLLRGMAGCRACRRSTRGGLSHLLRTYGLQARNFTLDMFIVAVDWVPALALASKSAEGGGIFGLLRIGRLPRILRVLRVLRLARIEKLEHVLFVLADDVFLSSESLLLILSVLKNIFCVLLCCHTTACIWYYVGCGEDEHHWVNAYVTKDGEPLQGLSLEAKYILSFHWVIAQWTPATMDVSPQNTAERYFAVVVTIAGVVTFSTFMGALTASITRFRTLGGNELSQFFLLRRYLRENGISRSLSVRICRYTDRALEMHRKCTKPEKVQYLNLLTGHLCVELQREIYLPHLWKLQFFVDYNNWDMEAMSHLCFTALGRVAAAKGDIIFSLGAKCCHLFCTTNGALVYQRRRGLKLTPGKTRPQHLVRVDSSVWCCEATLWVRWFHFGAMYALVESEMVEVNAEKFREVTTSRGSVFSRSAAYARRYTQSMWDSHGYAWDVPMNLLYPDSEDYDRSLSWWEREIVDSEMREASWWAISHSDGGSVQDLDTEEDVFQEMASVQSGVLSDDPGLLVAPPDDPVPLQPVGIDACAH